MWIMLNDAFFSIVAKDCARDELMVRARRPGDIEKVFPETKGKVTEFTASDYHYRAAIKKDRIKAAICGEIDRVVYSNFKSSVDDKPLHDAYLRVWTAMAALQPQAPYSGQERAFDFLYRDKADDLGPPFTDAHVRIVEDRCQKPKKAKKRPAKKNTRGR